MAEGTTEIQKKQPELLPMAPPAGGCWPTQTGAQGGRPRLDQPFVAGSLDTPAGKVPMVSSSLAWKDQWGAFKVRWGIGRMNYSVDPGLYALGEPNSSSPVLVTANYKLSFDRLRQALPNRRAWILVLDTKGINVWCAAGKGTFGTGELVERIRASSLEQVVNHRDLILPQLAAPGVAAHEVKKASGFRVIYGPIRSGDLAAFLDNGRKASAEMRRKTFTLGERAVLIPIELVAGLKHSLFVLPVFFLLGGLGSGAGFWANAMTHGLFAALIFLGVVMAGTILTPLLLPFLPGRAFTSKGLSLGILGALLFLAFWGAGRPTWSGRLEMLAWIFLVPAITAFLAMDFTGASTYTSLSGVRKEMRWGVPLEIGLGSLGLILWIGGRFLA